MRLRIYCLLAVLWPVMACYSQSPPNTIRPLTIGDTMPDITLTNVYNYPVSKIQLSDLKGKLVILDFWSTWCGACIEAFPKMHELQREFRDQLQVILVNTYEGDNAKKVKPFFEKRKARTGQSIDLPYSLLQKYLEDYFPYKFIPHYAWIDKRGRLIATTSQTEVTKENIQKILEGKVILLHKKEDLLDFDKQKPLFVNGNGGTVSNFLYRGFLTNYIEGVGTASGISKDSAGNIVRYYMLNNTLLSLIKAAYRGKMLLWSNRLILEVDETRKKSISLFNDSVKYENLYCYELSIPPSSSDQLQIFLQEDLFRVFHLKVRTESRELNCLVLRSSATRPIPLSKGGKESLDITEDGQRKYLKNKPISTLIDILNSLPAFRYLPVVDETNNTERIDIDFPYNFLKLDIPHLQTFLKNTGFEAEIVKRMISVSIITDK